MHPDLTNLLPEDRLLDLRRAYFMRLITVATGLGVIVIILTGGFLFPTYIYLQSEANTREQQLALLEAKISSSNEMALEERLSSLSKDATLLSALGGVASVSTVLRQMLAVPRAGVTLSGLTFTPSQGAKPAVLVVSGTADTRDHLRGYQLAFIDTPFVKGADLPISAYAKDSDITFSITVTLNPAP